MHTCTHADLRPPNITQTQSREVAKTVRFRSEKNLSVRGKLRSPPEKGTCCVL